jgi:hypothetical protein
VVNKYTAVLGKIKREALKKAGFLTQRKKHKNIISPIVK